jgi:hypothetical protein
MDSLFANTSLSPLAAMSHVEAVGKCGWLNPAAYAIAQFGTADTTLGAPRTSTRTPPKPAPQDSQPL